MTDCKGLIGKWFGHCFKAYLVKSKFKQNEDYSYNLHLGGDDILKYFDMKRDQYEIRCKRCGRKADE